MRHALLILVVTACGGSDSVAVDAPVASADTWTSFAESFTMTYCAASCHAPGGSGVRGGALDFTMFTNVFTNRAEIRCGVSAVALADCTGFPPPKQFPIAAPDPSDADRGRIVDWVVAGAPQ
jgi:hypothetical protein